ncbi:uncharacterized [Tachysurus ichikawai]
MLKVLVVKDLALVVLLSGVKMWQGNSSESESNNGLMRFETCLDENVAFHVTAVTETQQLELPHLGNWKSQHGSFAAEKNNIGLNTEQIAGVSAGPPEKLLNKRSMFSPTH